MIIGLSGYVGSGKTTAANYFVEKYGFKKLSFADPLRDFLYAQNPRLPNSMFSLKDIVDTYGWQGYKDTFYADSIRGLIQRTGTEAGRGVLGEDVWVNAAMGRVNGDTVFDDVRFPNEADAIVQAGGKLIRVDRPGVSAVNSHASESSLDGYAFTEHVCNDGSEDSLRELLERSVFGK